VANLKSRRKRVELSLFFLPSRKQVKLNHRQTILQGGVKAGVPFEANCGGRGICGKCKIIIIEPAANFAHIGHTSDLADAEKRILKDDEIKRGIRLACQTKLRGYVIVQNLAESDTTAAKISIKGIKSDIKVASGIRKILLKLQEPKLGERVSYLGKLIGGRFNPNKCWASLNSLQNLSKNLTRDTREMTVVGFGNGIIDIERGDTRDKNYGLAVDIGTTTLAGYLINLYNGEQLTAVAKTNSQTLFGSDVLTRIKHANTVGGLKELNRIIRNDVNEIITAVCDQGRVKQEHIYKMALVGNPCMEHLFLGIKPTSLGRKPFAPVMREIVQARAKQLGMKINSEGIVFCLPLVSGFIGADAVAMILASNIDEAEGNVLGIDIGTNTEIVLGTKGKLMACSAAAGPAFEGAHIQYGMRAANGAISKVTMDKTAKLNVIGNVLAKGICGSGLIDAVAELRRIGIIDQKGRILNRNELPSHISPNIRKKVSGNGVNRFEIAGPDESYEKKPIYLTQKDIHELLLAKGAIAAGINILLKEFRINIQEISEILLAGAFGNFINVENAIQIGLIPKLSSNKVRFVGNAAGEGAKVALLSEKLLKKAKRISEKVRYLELSDRKDFLDFFVESMVFPSIDH